MKEKKTRKSTKEEFLVEIRDEENSIPANEVIIEQQSDKIIITSETLKQKAVRLLSEKSEIEIEEYASKYGIEPTLETVADFLVNKKLGSLMQGKVW